jgi:MSHA pilin protein MshD
MCVETRIQRRSGGGFTMVELVLFIVVISIAVVGVLSVMTFTTSHSADPQMRKQALSIAEAVMEEVTLARFTYCDPADPNAETAHNPTECTVQMAIGKPADGSLPPFGNVGQYGPTSKFVATNPNPSAVPPVYRLNFNGDIPALSQYGVTVTVVPTAFTTALGTIPSSESLLVTVVVGYGNGESIRLDGMRTRYAGNLLP